MTVYGVTPTGFVIKRLPDIKKELEDEYRETFGAGLDVGSKSPAGQIIGIHAEREAKLWELAEDVYNSAFRDTAEGASLDNVGALTGSPRKDETFSEVTVILFGDEGTVIEAGKRASVDGNSSAIFALDNDAVIGPPSPMAQWLAFFFGTPVSGTFTLTFDGETTGPLAYDATAEDIQDALRALPNISDDLTVEFTDEYVVDGFEITFGGDMSGIEHPIIIPEASEDFEDGSGFDVLIICQEVIEAIPPRVFASMTAVESGGIQAPLGSLTVIETPVAGWTGITNPQNAVIGNSFEEDPEYRIRQGNTVSDSGSCTLDALEGALRNINGVTFVKIINNVFDSEEGGVPGHGFMVIILGGDDQLIANTIWENKPGGIQHAGNTSESVTDSQGYAQTVYYQRPPEIPIYVEIALQKNGDYPDDGDDKVKAAIVAMNSKYAVGEDVYVQPKLMNALAAIPGIDYAEILVRTVEADPGATSVTIGTYDIAKFETPKIEVTDI